MGDTRVPAARLLDLSPEAKCSLIIESIRERLMAPFDSPEDYDENKQNLSQYQIGLCSAWLCQMEVRNGGFHQFFSNSSGIAAREAVMGFTMIGAANCAQILREAIAMFPNGECPEEAYDRQADLNEISPEQFRPLEQRFFSQIQNDENFFFLAAQYVEKNQTRFVRP